MADIFLLLSYIALTFVWKVYHYHQLYVDLMHQLILNFPHTQYQNPSVYFEYRIFDLLEEYYC